MGFDSFPRYWGTGGTDTLGGAFSTNLKQSERDLATLAKDHQTESTTQQPRQDHMAVPNQRIGCFHALVDYHGCG